MDIKSIIETINALTEDEVIGEEILQDVPADEPEIAPAFNDGMSLADTLDTKAKVARCLETLKQAVEDFKTATAEKIDLLQDEMLLGGIVELDEVIVKIEQALAAGSQILGNSELNDAFRAELPQEEETPEVDEEPKAEEAEEDEETEEVFDFDAEAGLNLFPNE